MIFDEGVVKAKFNICKKQPRLWNKSENNPSVSFADSSLYTREPFCVTSFLTVSNIPDIYVSGMF